MKNVKYILRLSLTLLLITAVVSGALVGVNALTKDRIAANQQKKTQDALAVVLPGAEGMTQIDSGSGIVQAVYAPEKDSPVHGYAIVVAPTSGFNGQITLVVGIDSNKQVSGISVISHGETAGLGAVAADKGEKGQNFRNSFIGVSDSVTVSDIDAISGATITSKAVVEGVNAALEYVKNMG